MEDLLWIRCSPLPKIEDRFSTKKKRLARCLSILQQQMTAYGTAASIAQNYCDWSQTHTINILTELIHNRSITLTNGIGPKTRLYRLKNNFTWELVLAPLLFNIYRCELPTTAAKKFAYTGDLAIMHSTKDWKALKAKSIKIEVRTRSFMRNIYNSEWVPI